MEESCAQGTERKVVQDYWNLLTPPSSLRWIMQQHPLQPVLCMVSVHPPCGCYLLTWGLPVLWHRGPALPEIAEGFLMVQKSPGSL